MPDPYEIVQAEYEKLRGKFTLGQLTAEEFDAALHRLMVEDSIGRLWMIGANTGTWYYYDGAAWVAGKPPRSGAHRIGEPAPLRSTHPFPVALVLLGVVLLLAVAAVFGLLNTRSNFLVGISQAPLPTRLLPGSADESAYVVPTSAVSPTVAFLSETPVPTLVAAAAPTESLVTPTELATSEPLSSPTSARVTKTASPATAQSASPTPTGTAAAPAAAFPPDVYLTALTVNPSTPKHRAPATYAVTLLNTTNETRYFKLKIFIADPAKSGKGRDLGESPVVNITVPPGTNTFPVTFVTVNNPGGCLPLQASAGWRTADNSRVLFSNTGGSPFILNFQVC